MLQCISMPHLLTIISNFFPSVFFFPIRLNFVDVQLWGWQVVAALELEHQVINFPTFTLVQVYVW
jgi:hypothetical protein